MLIQSPSTAQSTARPALMPFVRAVSADLETPVSAYLKLAGQGPSFLLESVTGGEQVARYSFIGVQVRQAYLLRARTLERHTPAGVQTESLPPGSDALDFLRAELSRFTPVPVPGLPRFSGGLAGYLGYELAHQFEPSVPDGPFGILPDAVLLLADTLVAFDHAFGRMLLIANQPVSDPHDPQAVAAAGQLAQARLDALQARLAAPLPVSPPTQPSSAPPAELAANLSQAEFLQAVAAAKEHILAGDIFQVVLSQRFSRTTPARPFEIYRALRGLNPSPYMFFFDFDQLAGPDGLCLIGASPEMHVRLEGRTAAIRPIAGTRPRGQSPAEDLAFEQDLLADPKERAEHVMLVDLARNDLGRVCLPGSIRVPEMMGVERYSHVMHIVSQVEGQLQPGLDAFDLMRATFPAGTVSGAPKIRAMQIVARLEPTRRGPYAGAVGYFGFDGSLDTCITIRTLVLQGDEISVQAGAGIVADSEPEREYQETLNKARALTAAVAQAEAAR